MFTGTVMNGNATRGFWFAEEDLSHQSIFVHISQTDHRYLRIGERIRFDIEPNPKKPDKSWATHVEVVEPSTSDSEVRS